VRLEVDWALLREYVQEVPKYYGKRYYEIRETVRRRVSPRDERVWFKARRKFRWIDAFAEFPRI